MRVKSDQCLNDNQEYQLLRFIDLADVHTVAAIALKKSENSFGIVTSKRQYYVRASSAKEMQGWIDALKDAQEQVRQRSTMTQDMAAVELATSSGGENAPASGSRQRQTSTSPNLMPIDRQHGSKASGSTLPINIVIPGKGLYTSPAQARQSSTGASTMSPLTTTSDSEAGAPGGAEQFGLSYASSTGQSMASSPSRMSVVHHFDHAGGGGTSAGRQSPHSHSGGDEGNDAPKRPKPTKRSTAGVRDASVGSSGGEGSTGMHTGWTAAGEKLQSQGGQQQQNQGAVLSSSDEDGEGEDWDEDEVADRAMPLPGSTGLSASHLSQAPTGSGVVPALPPDGKPKVESEFFKDSNKVIHQGYLMKQSSRRKQWRKRWFTLTSAHLSYTRSHMVGKPHRRIPLTSILDAIEYTSKKAQAPVSQLQSPTPASPGPQSPSTSSTPFNFQLGASSETAPASSATQRGEAGASGENGGMSAGEAVPERRASVTASHPAPSMPHSQTPAKKKKENCFKIITPKRTYVVCAPTEEEEIKWLCALQALLAHWRGAKEGDAETAPAQPPPITTTQTGLPPMRMRRGSTAEDVNVLVHSPSPS